MGLLHWDPFEDPADAWERELGGGGALEDEEKPEGMSEVDWRIHLRCKKELKKKVPAWKTITNDTVTNNHMKVKKGMLYGITFPWTEALMHSAEYGPEWLTKAFHTAGTIPLDNKVVKIKNQGDYKITTGNNGGKFLFEVEYEKPDDTLHTKLFVKIPHAMEKETTSDRLSSSVNKQPMELYELNTSRLLEATLPCKIPRFYFGDISNETSNWILITEQVPFHNPEPLDFLGKTKNAAPRRLEPFQIEGPYDKCMDWTLLGDPAEYYFALIKKGTMVAGLAKAGKFGDPKIVAKHFENMEGVPVEAFGCNPAACTGQPPNQLAPKIKMGIEFFSEVAKPLYPKFCSDSAWQDKLRSTLMKLNAYAAESQYFFHHNNDYVALTHGNMNVDNAYFWRDDNGEMDLGVFDWGGMGARSLGHKLWWWLYCGDFDVLNANMDKFIECMVDTYEQYSEGLKLDKEVLRMMFILAALSQMFGLLAAIGQIYRMCPKKDFSTVKDRYDPRVGENINGKSTMRLYLQVMLTVNRMIEEWKADEVVNDFETKICDLLNISKKDESTMTA